jgi:enoyl-CoA hydratase/carnithine racemase
VSYDLSPDLLVDISDGVATVTFNRPDKLNAFNHELTQVFPKAMWALDADDSVGAIVVTGAGRAFCSGIDLEAGADTFGSAAHGKNEQDLNLGVNAKTIAEDNAFWRMRTPVIGAINGAAVGAGLTVAMLFDIRFVAEDAKLSFPFARLGVVADANATWLLPRLVGAERALELLLTGRRFTGQEMVDMGLALRALPKDEVLPAAQAFARDVAANTAPASAALTKKLVYENMQQLDRDRAFVRETELIWWLGDQPDAVEGVMAMLEKRPPLWKVSKHIAWPETVDEP